MAVPKNPEIPSFLIHKRSGNGRIKIDGRELWLGPADSPSAREKCDRIIAEWLANGRKLPVNYAGPTLITVSELIVQFMKFAEVEYAKNGQPTKEFKNLKPPLRIVQKLYGSTPAASFGQVRRGCGPGRVAFAGRWCS